MKVLVLAEHDNQSLKPATYHTVTAASLLSEDITLLVAGEHCEAVAESCAEITGVKKVLLADAACYAHGLAENLAALIVDLISGYDYLLAGATTFGKNVLPRVAGICNVAQISEVVEIIGADTFKRPIYAGNAFATVKSHDALKIVTIRTTAFPAAKSGQARASIERLNSVKEFKASKFIEQSLTVSKRPELTAARVVVSGGRGMQRAENFHLLEQLADCLGGAVGASRAAVDAGFVPNDYQVGQTGKVVAPDLYIAVGISGAIQHLAGMKDSKVIVAINKDADAPIFQVADYGLVGDLFEILPALIAALTES